MFKPSNSHDIPVDSGFLFSYIGERTLFMDFEDELNSIHYVLNTEDDLAALMFRYDNINHKLKGTGLLWAHEIPVCEALAIARTIAGT